MSKIPNDAWPILLDEMRHRLVSLELELRQLSMRGEIDSYGYQRRVAWLAQLKAKLVDMQTTVAARSPHFSSKLHPIPQISLCTPNEKALIIEFYKDQNELLKLLLNLNTKALQISQKVARNGLGIFKVFYFSKLRKLLARSEELQLFCNRKGKETYKNAAAVLEGAADIMDVKHTVNSKTLNILFNKVEDIFSRLFKLRSQINKKQAELEWQKIWLKEQERRVLDCHSILNQTDDFEHNQHIH